MRFKSILLGIGIFVVFLLLLNYGVEAFYPSPKYDDFCKAGYSSYPAYEPYPVKVGASECVFSKTLREEADKCFLEKGNPIYEYDDAGCYISIKECNYCQRDYDDAQKEYSKFFFIVALIAGIVALIVGYSVLSVEPVGSALISSGIGSIFFGSVRNWDYLSDFLRFGLLLLAFILLIWLALRMNKDKSFWAKQLHRFR